MTEQTTRTRQIHLPPPRVVTAPAVTVEASSAHVHGEALRSQLETLIGKHRDVVSLAQDTVKIAAELSRVVAVAYFANNPAGTLRVAANNWSGFAFDRDEFRKGVSAVCTRAATTKDREIFVSADTKNLTTLCLPINVRNAPSDVLAISLATTPEQLNTIDLGGVEMIVSGLRIWHSERCAIERDAELQGLAALVELVGQVERSKSVTQACHAIANELRDFLGCHRVALGLRKRTHAGCRLKTLSGAASFDQYSDVARQFQMACDESAIRETLAAWPSLNPNAEHTTIALRQLAEQQNVEATIGLPLLNEHELVGVLILAGRKESLLEARTMNLLQTAAPILASALQVTMRLEGGLLHRSWRRFATSCWTTRIAVTTLVGTAVAVLCTPWPYSMKVSCTLEPMTRRIVSAPYDGLVETSLTEPGSVVQQGQILARMDAREIRWELATVTAERSHALKEADTELSRENIGKAQLARMEAEGLKRKLELLQYREQNHELVSPIEGMVLNGSLEKLTGAPVKTGQPLFEVAELNPLRLELAVPAEDYFHIKPGQSVS
ncbi:MAG: HlyD family efflux transporter periplasmic adaptor subunit, partial [Fuerstia sp.]|nr:HlyD family efflux transporter periplasmic adaptor subunit [Fuerstiella sp.]